jgi:hypothetical protein
MDLENLFVSDLLNTLVGDTDDRSTTLAIGEEGDESESPGEPPAEPEPTSTTQALGEEGEQPDAPVTSDAVGEEGDQPEDHWDTEIEPEPEVTTQSLGEEGDQPEDHWDETGTGTDVPSDQGIWAGEDGNGGGCVIEVEDTSDPDGCEPVDEVDEADEDEAPTEADDPLNCW